MQEVKDTEFDQSVSSGVVLIDFTAEWCGPCQTMLPVIERIASAYDGKMAVYSVDIDKSPATAARNGVMSVPTFILFKDGKPVERLVGAVPERELRKRIDPHLESA
jgi:thioredoxin 1